MPFSCKCARPRAASREEARHLTPAVFALPRRCGSTQNSGQAGEQLGPLAARELERARHGGFEVGRARQRFRDLAQVGAVHELHRVVVRPARFARREDLHDVRVFALRERADSALESTDGDRILRAIRRQHLERDGAAEARLSREVDGAHAAFAELAEHFVVAETALVHGGFGARVDGGLARAEQGFQRGFRAPERLLDLRARQRCARRVVEVLRAPTEPVEAPQPLGLVVEEQPRMQRAPRRALTQVEAPRQHGVRHARRAAVDDDGRLGREVERALDATAARVERDRVDVREHRVVAEEQVLAPRDLESREKCAPRFLVEGGLPRGSVSEDLVAIRRQRIEQIAR